MAHVNRFHVRSALTVALATAVIALTACGGDDDDSSSAATADESGLPSEGLEPAMTDAPAATAAPAEAATDETVARAGSGSPLVVPAPDRLLIVEVTIGVEVTDVGTSVGDVIAISGRFGGQVYGSDVQLGDPATSTGRVVVKLPPQNVEAMIAEVQALGRAVSRFQNTDDVTDRVTDIDTRIITAQQSVDRVQRLLIDAKDLGEVVLLESELTARQTALEQLLAEARNLDNQTALATLTIDLSAAPVVVVDEPSDPDVLDENTVERNEGIGDAFATGGRAFLAAGAAVLIFLGYTAPFLVAAAIVAWVALAISRRRARRNRSTAPLLPPVPGADRQTTERDSATAARS
jgi:hypothetical protein